MTLDPDEMTPETWTIVGGRREPVPGAPLNTPTRVARRAEPMKPDEVRWRPGRSWGADPNRSRERPQHADLAASTFVLGAARIYSRNEATEGWEAFEAMLGGLEGGDAVAFSSGMAACAAVLGQLADGAHLVLGDDCYQGVAGIAEAGARDHGWRVERLPVTDPRWIERASGGSALGRVAVQPVARGRRRRGDLRGTTRPADADRGRQHVRDAAAAATARRSAPTSSCTRRPS